MRKEDRNNYYLCSASFMQGQVYPCTHSESQETVLRYGPKVGPEKMSHCGGGEDGLSRKNGSQSS